MKDRELPGKVHSSVYRQCQRRGYAAPVDVLMEVGVLQNRNMRTGGPEIERWYATRFVDSKRIAALKMQQQIKIQIDQGICNRGRTPRHEYVPRHHPPIL